MAQNPLSFDADGNKSQPFKFERNYIKDQVTDLLRDYLIGGRIAVMRPTNSMRILSTILMQVMSRLPRRAWSGMSKRPFNVCWVYIIKKSALR